MRIESGYFDNGVPYNRLGTGSRPLVVFQGLFPDSAPFRGPAARLFLAPFSFLGRDFTVYAMNRRHGLAPAATVADMADDYARAIEAELPAPVDVIGLSTGGAIAQEFAVRHPALLRRLVLYSSAYSLGAEGGAVQLRLAGFARAGRWGEFWPETFAFQFLPRAGVRRSLGRPAVWAVRLLAPLAGRAPRDPSDFLVQVAAEDRFDFRSRLGEIAAPTLVIGGERDPYYSAQLFRDTAAGIPNSRLVLIPKAGHGPGGKGVAREMLGFLLDR